MIQKHARIDVWIHKAATPFCVWDPRTAPHQRHHRLGPKPMRLHAQALLCRDALQRVVRRDPLLRLAARVTLHCSQPVQTTARGGGELSRDVQALAVRRDDRCLAGLEGPAWANECTVGKQ